MSNPFDFTASLKLTDLPSEVRHQLDRCLLDLVGVGIGGATTPLSAIIRDHAVAQFGGSQALWFDGRKASAAGIALAAGMTIDALDGHDGYNPAKGHVGCGLVPGLTALAVEGGASGAEFLSAVAAGYELGSRLGPALHASVPDYHTSGAWIAVAVAVAGARLLGLDPEQTRHAAGIAEYHGPRSQMMRCIDHPTMLKDGSGWGAMAGVSAVILAREGFTGAPALTVEQGDHWGDLGERWLILEQYFKPYPICRWAQAPVEAALVLRSKYDIAPEAIEAIRVTSFHEATRLATITPQTTEEAQYSTVYPVAVALAKGAVSATDVSGEALRDPVVARLAARLSMNEDAYANERFPEQRPARVSITFDGRTVTSDWTEPRWDATCPPSDAELEAKFHGLADPAIGAARAKRIKAAVAGIEADGLGALHDELVIPIR